MRIAMLAPFGLQPKGTVSARMVPLAQALARRGHMVRIVIPPWDDPSEREAERREITSVAAVTDVEGGHVAGVHTVALPLPRRLPNSLALTYGLVRQALRPTTRAVAPFEHGDERTALRALTSFRAEVVHVFKPVGYSGLAGFVLSAMRVPWVLDVDDWEGPGGWADVNRYPLPERLSLSLMEAALPRMARSVTAASRTLEARAWHMGLTRRRVRYMPNGVWEARYASWAACTPDSPEVAHLRATLFPGGGPVVLLYTRFAEFPYRWPLEVFRRLLPAHPNAHLLVVGSGFNGEEERLWADAEAAGTGDRVVVTGRVPEAQVPLYLALGDVLMYPMADTLINRAKSPVKVLEPMLMGLPIVAHRVGQAAEFLGDAGVLVEPGDLGGMARAASRLLTHPDQARALGERARTRVWSRFSWDRLSAQAEEAYRSALGR
jgi:glycosyltransferase involved in cell wall biosynthesis